MSGLLIAYPATLILGLPAYFLLLHFQTKSYLVHAVVGTVAALVIGLLLFELPLKLLDQVAAFIIAVCGAAVATTLRAIAGIPDAYDVTR